MADVVGERESLDRALFPRVLVPRPGLRVEFARLDLVTAKTAYVYPEHLHTHFEIIIPLNGPYECSINGEWITAQTDHVVIIQPSDRHADRITVGQKYCAIGMCVFWEVHTQTVLFKPGTPASMQVTKVHLGDLMDLLVAEVQCRDSVAALRQDALVFEILMRLIRSVSQGSLAAIWCGDNEGDQFNCTVQEIFNARAGGGLTAAEIAEAMHMSASVLNASFRKYLQTTPAKALAEWRVDQARKLLLNGDTSIGDIALRLGFADASHFTHVFTRMVGISPRSFRRNGQNKT